jgi:A/G-specific adenine glycosylase
MMLRRTQARQVPPVYRDFLQKYPDVISLDNAAEEEVQLALYPLGLKWRARNFKSLAHELIVRFQGQIPQSRTELLNLPGIGPYVADAVRCFAFGEMATLADTNTVRVAARYFGFTYNAESRRQKSVVSAISRLIDTQVAAQSNYALLDFAAQICQARLPVCDNCPLAKRCKYIQSMQSDVPIRLK